MSVACYTKECALYERERFWQKIATVSGVSIALLVGGAVIFSLAVDYGITITTLTSYFHSFLEVCFTIGSLLSYQ